VSVGTRLGESVMRVRDIFRRRPAAALATKTATARLTGDSWRTEVQMGTHTLIVDQPAALGGEDLGPNPGDLVRAALAACLATNYAMHAPRFGVVLDGIEVAVETDIDLSVAWGFESERPPGFTAIRYVTTLTTSSSPERVHDLVTFAESHSPSLDDLRRALDVSGHLIVKRMDGEGNRQQATGNRAVL
jgi:uncharacterized OsmC-like protein